MSRVFFEKVNAYGAAGGSDQGCIVNLRILGQAQTVEQVRALAQAAPEMLEALKELEAEMRKYYVDDHRGNERTRILKMIERACTAIAKAEGRE